MSRRHLLIALAVATGCWAIAPSPTATSLAVRHGDLATAMAGCCGLLALALAALLVGAAALVLASSLPGAVGAAADAAARRLLPRALRAGLVAALSLGGSATPLLAGAASADTHRPVPHSARIPDLDRPGFSHLSGVELTAPSRPQPVPSVLELDRPADVSPSESPTAPAVTHLTTAPATPSSATPPTAHKRRPATTDAQADNSQTPASTQPVVVAPGDSLWRIAARALGPEADDARTAASWPLWWQANRDVIGDDPNVIHPGQQLNPPTNRAQQP